MKILLPFCAALAAVAAAQTTPAVYVKQFAQPGWTVGQMARAAQDRCASGGICVLIFDRSLAKDAAGTLPARCAGCVWLDYRGPFDAAVQGEAAVFSGGDPSGQTDSAAAWQAALDHLTSGTTLLVTPGVYRLIATARVTYADSYRTTKPTHLKMLGLRNLRIVALGKVQFISDGAAADRVMFDVDGDTNISFEGFTFGPTEKIAVSEPGKTYLASEDWEAFEVQGTAGFTCLNCTFSSFRDGIDADAYHSAEANSGIRLLHSVCQYGVNFCLITRNSAGNEAVDITADHNGRSWSQSTETIAFSDNSTKNVFSMGSFRFPFGINARVTSTRNKGPTRIAELSKIGNGECIEVDDADGVTIDGANCTNVMGNITAISRSANVATVRLDAANYSLAPGYRIILSGVNDRSFDASTTVARVIGPTEFTYRNTGPDGSSHGGIVSDTFASVLVTADTSLGNNGLTIENSTFTNGGACTGDYFDHPTNVKTGLTMLGNHCENTYAPQHADPNRREVDVEGNVFHLNPDLARGGPPGGQQMIFAGDGTKFIGNNVRNGYIYNHGSGSAQHYEQNHFEGNSFSVIPVLFDLCSSKDDVVTGNGREGGFSSEVNPACGSGNAVRLK